MMVPVHLKRSLPTMRLTEGEEHEDIRWNLVRVYIPHDTWKVALSLNLEWQW